jgi:3-methylfumaryl-CoA hydratase
MWAGGTLRLESPLVLGQTLERTSTIRSITPKGGRTGRLCFVTVDHELTAGGRRCLLEEQTIVYRDLPGERDAPAAAHDPSPGGVRTAEPARALEPAPVDGEPAPVDAEPAPVDAEPAPVDAEPAPVDAEPAPADGEPAAASAAAWQLDSVALFRYSALTFNAHRIHYDADYCRDVEGYPGLVIHGPLIATLLLDLAAREGRPLGRFSYRARHPLFLPHPFTVNGRSDGDRTTLWAADHEGRLAMEAEAGPG